MSPAEQATRKSIITKILKLADQFLEHCQAESSTETPFRIQAQLLLNTKIYLPLKMIIEDKLDNAIESTKLSSRTFAKSLELNAMKQDVIKLNH